MIDPATTLILEALDSSKQEILENQERILEDLNEIKQRQEQLGKKLDERILVDARTALSHLVYGLRAENEDIRNEEFRDARSKFNELANLDPEGTTEGTSGTVSNKVLICLGCWGNFHYFNLRGDWRNAALQVFECTQKYPLEGVNTFPAKLFFQDYGRLIADARAEYLTLQSQLKKVQNDNLWKNAAYYGKQGIRVGVTGVTGITSGLFSVAGAVPVAALGAFATRALWKKMAVDTPQLQNTEVLERKLDEVTQQINTYINEIVNECTVCYDQIQKSRLPAL